MKRHALFIGIDRYEDTQISSLVCAEADAVELHGFFKHRVGYEVAEFLLAPSADQILDTVARLVAPLGPGDLFLFFFAGHGVTHERRDLLLSAKARHARLRYFYQTVPMDLLLEETTRPGLDRVFVLDSCRSNLLCDRQAGAAAFDGMAATRDIVAKAGGSPSGPGGSLALVCSCEKGGQAGEIPERRAGVFRLALQRVLDAAHQEGRDAIIGDELLGAVAQEMDRLAQEHQLPRRQRPSREVTVGNPPRLFVAKSPKSASPEPPTRSQPNVEELLARVSELEEIFTGGSSSTDLVAQGNAAYNKQNFTEAVRCFREAAEQGKAMAQYNLGICYRDGCGVAKDEAEAARWFRKGAEQGYSEAQFQLGGAYYFGEGVPKNEEQAIIWYRKAADQGDSDAKFALRHLESSVRNFFVKGQISAAPQWIQWLLGNKK